MSSTPAYTAPYPSRAPLPTSLRVQNRILDVIDPILGLIERVRFYKHKRFRPNLKDPKKFSEKVLWKKLYDRNPLLSIAADKVRARDYVRRVVGDARAEEILMPQLHVAYEAETIPFDELPEAYILKASHASGWNLIVDPQNRPERSEIVAACRRWLNTRYGVRKCEWAYRAITPAVVLEKLLIAPDGQIPHDYKLYLFHGRCEFLHVDVGRFGGKWTRNFYDPDWNVLPFALRLPNGPREPRPHNLEEMIALAEDLGGPFDFVRVDLYAIEDRIYFGELTHYPGSGLVPFYPPEADRMAGSYWRITPKYWLHGPEWAHTSPRTRLLKRAKGVR